MAGQTALGQNNEQPHCVSQTSASMVQLWSTSPPFRSSSLQAPLPIEDIETIHSQQTSNTAEFIMDTKEDFLEGTAIRSVLFCLELNKG